MTDTTAKVDKALKELEELQPTVDFLQAQVDKERFIKRIAGNIDTKTYDVLCELYYKENASKIRDDVDFKIKARLEIVADDISYFLDYIDFDIKDLKEYQENDNDFWNDRNINNTDWETLSNQYCDGAVSIYHYDLWQKASILSEYTEDSVSELGMPDIDKNGITSLFSQGEYYFYDNFARQVLELLKSL